MDILQIKCIRCGDETGYPLAVNHLSITPPSRAPMPPTSKTYYLSNSNYVAMCADCYRGMINRVDDREQDSQLLKWKVDMLHKLITEQLDCTVKQTKQVESIIERGE